MRNVVKVSGFDIETDNGQHRVVMTLNKWGLWVELYRAADSGGTLWRLEGSALVEKDDLRDFSRTLARFTGVLAPSVNSSKRPQTVSKNDEKTGSEKVAKKAKEITV